MDILAIFLATYNSNLKCPSQSLSHSIEKHFCDQIGFVALCLSYVLFFS